MNIYRADFPIFEGNDTIYFDSAATAQRPRQVIEAIAGFYERHNANPLRGLYDWSIAATDEYEAARVKVASLLNAESPEQIVFTRNTTEALNLVAYTWALEQLHEGDELVLTIMEHHSNMLPWQMAAERTGARLVVMEPEEDGTLTSREIQRCITEKTRLVAVGHVSNVYGVTNPVKEIAEYAHKISPGAVVVVDGAQAAPHIPVDVRELGADFYAISGHKLLGPMGIGALYGRRELLESMRPFLSGGEMIEYVTREVLPEEEGRFSRVTATYAELPHKFEAGTVNAAGAIGMGAAIDYLLKVGFDTVSAIEERLTSRLMEGMRRLPYIRLYGSDDPAKHSGIVTFTMEGVHPHDVASVLNDDHICIRAGHHCAQPLMAYIGAGSTARASLYLYNTEEEVDIFLEKLAGVRRVMGYDN